jgi:hypothetical protein
VLDLPLLPLFFANTRHIPFIMPKIDLRNAPGTVVRAAANKVLGKCTARAHLSNTNYCLTFQIGVIIRSSDGKEGGSKCAQWKLNSKFSILNQEGAELG